MKKIKTGIELLDQRLGGVRAGGVYVMTGVPGSGKLVSVLQFLNAGITEGERVALLTGASPQQVFEQAKHWGFPLEDAWKRGQLRLLGFTDDFERLLLRAADPAEVFHELTGLAGGDITRLGIDPGKPLWETRAGTALANRFIQWAESSGATTLATLGSDLNDTLSPATEWVLQTASGVLKLERLPTGFLQLWIRRISPPTDSHGALSMELVPGKGMQEPQHRLDRRATDSPVEAERRLGVLELADRIPSEILGWAKSRYEVVEFDQSLRLISDLQEGVSFGLILIYLDRAHGSEAIEACRVIRSVTPAPVVLVADDRLRAADRTGALEAGANDFLTDNVNVAELASRIEQALEIGRGKAPARRSRDTGSPVDYSNVLDPATFARAVEERLAGEDGAMFTFVEVEAPKVKPSKLSDVLLKQIRGEEGDLVGRVKGGFGVVLQSARPSQASAFMGRVQGSLGPKTADDAIKVEVLSSATEAERIAELVEEDDGEAPSSAA